MKNAILTLLTTAINSYLKLDPESQHRLAKLAGKSISIELLPFHYQFQLHCLNNKIEVLYNPTEQADAVIVGTPLQLMSVALEQNNRQRFFAEDLQIQGDAVIGQNIIALFDELEIDWEEILSHWIGDAPSFHLSKTVQHINKWIKTSKQTLVQQLSEYLHEEIIVVPPREALKDFYNDIDELSMDVDRLTIKINHFKNSLSQKDNK